MKQAESRSWFILHPSSFILGRSLRMGESLGRSAGPELLHYRPWQGTFLPPGRSVWPIARTALGMMFRRRLFWVLYALGMMVFLLFFFGQYLAAFSETLDTGTVAGRGGLRRLIHRFLSFLDGSGETYLTFIRYQGYIVMIVLTLAGSLLLGNDLRFGSLPYYLSKPLSRWHYLVGKGLAVAVFINLMTTVPAIVLWIEFGMLYSVQYYTRELLLLLGVLGYGLMLTLVLSTLLLATAMWVRRTVPLIMVWSTLFVFLRVLADTLVTRLHFHERWRLIDLWNDTVLVGGACLGMETSLYKQPDQPHWYEAGLLLGGVTLLCLTYLIRRIRAVEIVK
jgi:ABC-2 type transport system permease protein